MNSNTCINTGNNSLRKWNIGNYIRTIMVNDSTIQSLVGNDIYPLVAPENTSGDFIVYSRERYSKKWSKIGVWNDECTVAVTVISDNYDSAIQIAEAADVCLTGTHSFQNDDGITFRFSIDIEDSTETFTDGKYIETILLTIK